MGNLLLSVLGEALKGKGLGAVTVTVTGRLPARRAPGGRSGRDGCWSALWNGRGAAVGGRPTGAAPSPSCSGTAPATGHHRWVRNRDRGRGGGVVLPCPALRRGAPLRPAAGC